MKGQYKRPSPSFFVELKTGPTDVSKVVLVAAKPNAVNKRSTARLNKRRGRIGKLQSGTKSQPRKNSRLRGAVGRNKARTIMAGAGLLLDVPLQQDEEERLDNCT